MSKVLKCSSYNIQTMLPSFLYNFSQVYILTLNIWKVPNLKLKLFPALIWTAQSSSGYSTYLSIKFLSMQYWLLFFLFQVHINLGAGESELSSPLNMKLNDLQWHTVKLIRNEAEMELVLDSQHTSRWLSLSVSLTTNQPINIIILG